MKLSDYVARFLARQGIRHVFAITGGASIHMIHSIAATDGVDFIAPGHEQAGAFMADAYARVTGGLGCAMATSGPGATNLITGIASAYYDSVPVLFITGQVTRGRLKGDLKIRQNGFQETPIVDMVKPITKYAVMVTDPMKIRSELEKAVYLATHGRPGPVVVDIPDDLQRFDVHAPDLEPFLIESAGVDRLFKPSVHWFDIEQAVAMISTARRPVVVIGTGVRRAKAEAAVNELINRLKFPVVPTWGALDMFPHDHPYLVGAFGTQGTRAANFAIANSDLIISIGARMGSRETGTPLHTFARSAKIIMVDIDKGEIDKFTHFGRPIDLPIPADAKDFAEDLSNKLRAGIVPSITPWWVKIAEWKRRYSICTDEMRREFGVNPYVFVEVLSQHLREDDLIFTDTGCSVAWMCQAFQFKKGQRLFHAFNNTPMGWGLPAAIGGAIASGHRVICVSGDGGLLMNMQEFATASKHNIDLKLFLLNNNGHAMCQQTEDEWLCGVNHASSSETGLAFPDWGKSAAAAEWAVTKCGWNSELETSIRWTMTMRGPVLNEVTVDMGHKVYPKAKYGYPIEDSEPLLPRGEFAEQMIVHPMTISVPKTKVDA